MRTENMELGILLFKVLRELFRQSTRDQPPKGTTSGNAPNSSRFESVFNRAVVRAVATDAGSAAWAKVVAASTSSNVSCSSIKIFRWSWSNYRPICLFLAMTILYGRLYPILDQNQAEDQAGFRNICQTTDHFATYRMME